MEYIIEELINNLEDRTGHKVFFDDSRMWTLGYREDGTVYGVQRGYLGGGVRGAIRSNIKDEAERELFTQTLKDIDEYHLTASEIAQDELWNHIAPEDER